MGYSNSPDSPGLRPCGGRGLRRSGPGRFDRPCGAAREVAGSVETRLVLNRFAAVGTKLVGYGTATATYRNAAGVTTSVTKKPYRLSLRSQRNVKAQEEELCHILFLQLDELDLTLLGLRVFLRAATEGQPIELSSRRGEPAASSASCSATSPVPEPAA